MIEFKCKIPGCENKAQRNSTVFSSLTPKSNGMCLACALAWVQDEVPLPDKESTVTGKPGQEPVAAILTDNKKDMVNHPPHYNNGKIEVSDFIEDQALDFFAGNVVKYVIRAPLKGSPVEDLHKARWYLDRLIRKAEKQGTPININVKVSPQGLLDTRKIMCEMDKVAAAAGPILDPNFGGPEEPT